MKMGLAQLMWLCRTARDLNGPDTANSNPEYARGQVELICDVSGIPCPADAFGEEIERYITHRSHSIEIVAAAIEQARMNP